VAVGLDLEKQTLEKDSNFFQEECLREESRYHYLQHLAKIVRIKVDRAEQEKNWQAGKGRMLRDFASMKDFYTVMLCATTFKLPFFVCTLPHTIVRPHNTHSHTQLHTISTPSTPLQNKLTQQEHMVKQLRKRQKELKENSGALTNQKSNFLHLQALLDIKSRFYHLDSNAGSRIPSARFERDAKGGGSGGGGQNFMAFDNEDEAY
jgi:hypothetical protein